MCVWYTSVCVHVCDGCLCVQVCTVLCTCAIVWVWCVHVLGVCVHVCV